MGHRRARRAAQASGIDQGHPRWCRAARVRTVGDVDLAPPPADSAPVLDPPPDELRPPEPVFGGVAALLAARLGIDALWIRIAFVLLALVGGVGLLVYAAMWLAFVVGAGTGQRWARVAGGVLLVFGLPLMLTGGFGFFDGPVAVLALLAGLAVALWQPDGRTDVAARGPPPAPVEPARDRRPAARGAAAPAAVDPRAPDARDRRARRRAGALIDQANGGRLHPEQWLGAAAVVCGVGLVVGAFAGRALWLAVPAVLFAGAGFVAGEAARVGVEPTALFGDESCSSATVERRRRDPARARRHRHGRRLHRRRAVGAGDVDARVGIGEIDVRAAGDVTVEVRADVDHGTVDVDGVRRG